MRIENTLPMEPSEMFLGTIPGSIGETSTLAILIGAAILIFTGIPLFIGVTDNLCSVF